MEMVRTPPAPVDVTTLYEVRNRQVVWDKEHDPRAGFFARIGSKPAAHAVLVRERTQMWRWARENPERLERRLEDLRFAVPSVAREVSKRLVRDGIIAEAQA